MHFYKNPSKEWDHIISQHAIGKSYPFNEWFRGTSRIYLPFDSFGGLSEDDQEIIDLLEEEGYLVHDYKGGYCRREGSNTSQKIGKVLSRLKKKDIRELREKHARGEIYNLRKEINETSKYYDEIFSQFSSSPHRAAKSIARFLIVISQDPYDVAMMSTDRRWESCMTLGSGVHHRSVLKEIKNGGFVAYLIREEDRDISDPLCRIHVRHFLGIKGPAAGYSIAKAESSVYGEEISGFAESVDAWIYNHQGEIPEGLYSLQGGYYSDTFSGSQFFGGCWDLSDDPNSLLAIYQGHGLENIPYTVWRVVIDESVCWRTFEDEDEDSEDRIFYDQEAAEDFVWDHPLNHDEDWRFEIDTEAAEQGEEAFWSVIESGEFVHSPFQITKEVVDRRQELQARAAAKMVLLEPGILPLQVIKEIKEKYPTLRVQLIKKYPELFQDETSAMSKYVLTNLIKSLPIDKQRPHIEQLKQSFEELVNDPASFLPECPECGEPIRPDQENTTICPTAGIRHHASCLQSHQMLEIAERNRQVGGHSDYKFAYLKLFEIIDLYQTFQEGPIPDHLIQKLITVPDRTYFADVDKLKFHASIIHTLSMTGSDTPTVQEYFWVLRPYWMFEVDYWNNYAGKRIIVRRQSGANEINITNLGSAVARLGANGRQFIPFIEERLLQLEQLFGSQIFDPNNTQIPSGFDPKQIGSHSKEEGWERILRLTERYLYILDSIKSGQGRSKKYRFSWR